MQLDIAIIISQILAFLIMLWVLKKCAWKPLLKILKERKEKIQAEFETIEAKKKELEQLTDLYTSKLSKIEEETNAKIAEALEAGHQMASQIHEEAHAEAKSILQKAQKDIENELLKAQIELKSRISSLVILIAQKLIGEKMDAEKDKKLVEALLDEAIHK
jgi:F-type H+-transporting ATPase subunit b